VVVVAEGELDLGSVELLRDALRGPDGRGDTVVLDLRKLTFIDSSGLSLVVGEHQRARAESFDFAVAVGGAREVQRLFDLAGLQETVRLVEHPDSVFTS